MMTKYNMEAIAMTLMIPKIVRRTNCATSIIVVIAVFVETGDSVSVMEIEFFDFEKSQIEFDRSFCI